MAGQFPWHQFGQCAQAEAPAGYAVQSVEQEIDRDGGNVGQMQIDRRQLRTALPRAAGASEARWFGSGWITAGRALDTVLGFWVLVVVASSTLNSWLALNLHRRMTVKSP